MSIIGSRLQRSGQIVLQFLDCASGQHRAGRVGSKNLTWHGTLVAQASQIDIISCGERGSAYCGALVMRSDGVCMIIGINEYVLDSEFAHQVVSQTSCC